MGFRENDHKIFVPKYQGSRIKIETILFGGESRLSKRKTKGS